VFVLRMVHHAVPTLCVVRPSDASATLHTVKGEQMSAIAEPTELSREDFTDLLEGRVQAALDMSLSSFVAALRDGQLDPESPRVAELAILVGAPGRS